MSPIRLPRPESRNRAVGGRKVSLRAAGQAARGPIIMIPGSSPESSRLPPAGSRTRARTPPAGAAPAPHRRRPEGAISFSFCQLLVFMLVWIRFSEVRTAIQPNSIGTGDSHRPKQVPEIQGVPGNRERKRNHLTSIISSRPSWSRTSTNSALSAGFR